MIEETIEIKEIVYNFNEQQESLYKDIDLVAGSINRGTCTLDHVLERYNYIFPCSYNKDIIIARLLSRLI